MFVPRVTTDANEVLSLREKNCFLSIVSSSHGVAVQRLDLNSEDLCPHLIYLAAKLCGPELVA